MIKNDAKYFIFPLAEKKMMTVKPVKCIKVGHIVTGIFRLTL